MLKVLWLVLLIAPVANAQVIVACASNWGASDNCNGCSGLAFRTPAPTLKVRTTANQYWVELSTLKPTDSVYTQDGKKDGDPVVCHETKTILVSAIGGTPPVVVYGALAVTWSAPSTSVGGGPVTPTGYHVRWSGPANGEFITGNVLAYTNPHLPVGSYLVSIATLDATGESDQSNRATGTVVAPPPSTELIVTSANTKSYRIVQNVGPTGVGDLVMVVSGSVPVGAVCDAAQSITTKGATYYRIDWKVVVFSGNNRPPTAWAVCSH